MTETGSRVSLAALTGTRRTTSPEPPKGQGCPGDDWLMGITPLRAEVADRLASAGLTYREAGATAGDLPSGYRHVSHRVLIGRGPEVLASAGEAVFQWQVQLRSGLRVSASSPAARPGTVLLVGLGIGPLRIQAPCRVVYTVNEPRRRGFAYGTLPGHPETGEEAFIIEHHADNTVNLTITAFSRPASRLAKIAGPLGTATQRKITARYLRSLAPVTTASAAARSGRPRPRPRLRRDTGQVSARTARY